jgi:hypothetical protein
MKMKCKTKMKLWLPLTGLLLMSVWITAPVQAVQEKEAKKVAAGQKEEQKLKEEQWRQQEQQKNIKELTIRNSGFRSRSTVVIRYRDEDKQIVEIIENGKSLPESEFSRYESVMQKVLELPEIDKLLPEIDRVWRRAESLKVPEEAVLREMMELRGRLRGMNSGLARRYRETTELQAMASMGRMAEKISESEELSSEEKIQKLKELFEQAKELEVREEDMARQTMLTQFAATLTARKLIEEIEQSSRMSQEEKLQEIQELLSRTREMERVREGERRAGLLEFKVAETMRKMLREIAEKKHLSDVEKEREMQALIEESRQMDLENDLMIKVEKFKFDLQRFLEKEGLLPKGKAEFVLKKNASTIAGKKLPDNIHERILAMCSETLGKKFEGDTKIVLQLNEKR